VTITVLNGLAGRCDHALVAKLAGMAALGYYGRAYALANIPSQNFTNIIAPVMLPALRSVSHDRQRFRRAFLKCLAAYAVGAVAVAVAFAVVARPLVLYVLGQSGKWEPVLPPLYVLLLFGVAKAIGSVTPAALFVLNRPWTVTLCTGVWCAGVCGGCYPMIRAFGVMGAAWTVVLSSLASASLAVYLVLRAVRLDGAGPRDPR
jgi:O-antigen/teichoic acid export membrane protein